MNFGFTASAEGVVGRRINDALIYFEDILNDKLADKFYGGGIVRFVVCFISIDDDNEMNVQHRKYHTKVGRYRDSPSADWKRYISVAPIVLPGLLLEARDQEIFSLLMVALISEIEMGKIKWPKGFDLLALSSDIKNSFMAERLAR